MRASFSAAVASGNLAVVTGAAGDIGPAAARASSELGVKVVLDQPGEALDHAAA